jgi:ADP-heptose:LPS heptosyltransferase
LLTKLSRAKLRVGYEKHARRLRRLAYTSLSHASVRELHTVDFHLVLLAELGVPSPVAARGTPLKLPPDAKKRARFLLEESGISGPYAVVHPGTAREEKFWMNDRWAEVCASLHRHHNMSIALTGAGDGLELPHLEALRRRLRVPVADLTGRLTLVEFAAVIAGCEIIVGVDSMAMHLAALFARPQVALFGPTNPYHWRPRHARARVLLAGSPEPATSFSPKERKRDMKLISTQAVVDATRSLLSPE